MSQCRAGNTPVSPLDVYRESRIYASPGVQPAQRKDLSPHEEVEYQLVPLPAAVINLPGRSSTAIQELCFEAENIPPLGFTAYYIAPVRDQLEENEFAKKFSKSNQGKIEAEQEIIPFISNEYIKVTVDKVTGLLESIQHVDGVRIDVNQNFYYYAQGQQTLQSGAYSFRPDRQRPVAVTDKVAYNTIRGSLVKEIRQRFSDWITQIIRLYRGEEFVELEWIIGPVPIGQNLLMINCDAIAVTETFLTNSVLDSELTSNGWSVLRRDRVTGAGGGVMLVARPGVKVTRCCDLETTNGEDLWERCVTEHASFYICVVYIHPRASDELYMSWFLKVESFIDSLNGDVIIVGDLNLNPVYTSSSILSYYCYFLTVNGLKERNEVKNAYGGQLDVVLVSDCIDHVEVTEVDGGGLVPKRDTYHPPLEVVFSSNYHSIEKAHPSNIDTDKDWNFPKGNYKHMYYLIAEASWQEVFEAGDVDTALDCFYDVLYTIFDKCVPKKKRSRKPSRRYPIWFTFDLIKDIKYKAELHRQWKSTRNRIVYNLFSELRTKIKQKMTIAYNEYIKRIQCKLNREPKAFWHHVNSLKVRGGLENRVRYNGRDCVGSDAAQAFSSFFSSVFLPDVPNLDHENQNNHSKTANLVHVDKLTISDVETGINKLKPNSAIGPDNIPAYIIKGLRRNYSLIISTCSALRGQSDCPELVAQVVRLFVPTVLKHQLRPRRHPLLAVPVTRTVAHANSPLVRALTMINALLVSAPETDLGKEVVSLFTTNITSNGEFFTDSNSRQMMRRTCWNESASTLSSQQLKKPIAACYYPVTSRICIHSGNASVEMCVLVDRTEGGTSRLLTDDGFGLEETLNEESYGVGLVVKGKHRILFGNYRQEVDDQTFSERMSLFSRRWQYEPWLFLTSGEKLNRRKWQNLHGLPRHIHVLTLEPWKAGTVLLRLENTLESPIRERFRTEKSDGPEDYITKPTHITVELRKIFLQMNIKLVRETTLAANQWLDDARQMDWSTRSKIKMPVYADYDRRKRSINISENVMENLINDTTIDNVRFNDTTESPPKNTSIHMTTRFEINDTIKFSEQLKFLMTQKTPKMTFLSRSKPSKLVSDWAAETEEVVSSEEDFSSNLKKRSPRRRGGSRSTKRTKPEREDTTSTDDVDDGITKSIYEMYYKHRPRNQNKSFKNTEEKNRKKKPRRLRDKNDYDYEVEQTTRRYFRSKSKRVRGRGYTAEMPFFTNDRKKYKGDRDYITTEDGRRMREMGAEDAPVKEYPIKTSPRLRKRKDNSGMEVQDYSEEEDLDNVEKDIGERRMENNRRKRTLPKDDEVQVEPGTTEPTEDTDFVVTIRPTQIRTFVIWFENNRKNYNT
ncbi:hypothetical protein HW555_008753 [Spodoptera exigua]|uniref:Endonuclease/exonuclease/phosphatase domain-containing protein n=1 Tax=Spodoptera exigua TaxID=7107 RepID=A0A835GDQ0_SPOEX|nr:hypothetical protein HW555_008753 [Spodoptera exigua]